MESKTKARFIVLAIFVIGFAAGALSMNLYERSAARNEHQSDSKARPHEQIVRRMNQKLGLTPEQQRQISAILEETFEQYSEIRKEMEPHIKDFKPKFDAVRQNSRERVRAILTPEQLPEFEEMIKENDSKREKRNENGRK